VQICPNCGEENPDRFRLCGYCGTKLAAEAPAPEVRKTVTVVFSDLKGSTSLGERLDSETLRQVLNVYFTAMKAVLERHGGTVEKFIGDAIMAVFGLPRLHEDDALRAVRAASEMKATLVEVNEKLQAGWGVRLENRTGVNTGEVVAGDVTAGQRLVTGDTVNTAARLEQAAPASEVLVGESTYRLVKDAVEVEPVEPLELKGKAEPVPAYRLLSVKEGEAVTRRLHAPMVGRIQELNVLLDALAGAEEDRRCRLVTVLGPAGVGKSRLLHEFLGRASERAATLRGRCLPYGDGITYWPLAEVVREAAGVSDEDSLEAVRAKLLACVGSENADVAQRVGAAIGFSTESFPVEETIWAARRLFEILAASRPLVVLIDDIHWAEDTFLELLTAVADQVEQAPLVLVCSSRPDLLEEHPDWAAERANASSLALAPLNSDQSVEVIENLLGTSEIDEELQRKVVLAAEGNPLFVEQMVSMLVDDGILSRDAEGQWRLTSDVGSFTMPASIQALLSARLDHLGVDDRTVIQYGSVIGQRFRQAAVEALVPEPLAERVPPSLHSLTNKQLILPPEAGQSADQDSYRFAHILIRDASYHGLLKRTRAELHERFVDWVEREDTGRVTEFEEIRGYHLEEAYLIRVQLGVIDDHVRTVGARGSAYLSSAGRRALARGDMPAAASLLERAAALLPFEDPARPRLFLDAGDALMDIGEFTRADGALAAAIDGAQAIQDAGLKTVGELVRLQVQYAAEAKISEAEILERVRSAIPLLERLGDHEGLARAWRLLALVHGMATRHSESEAAARRLIAEARAAGNHLMETRFTGFLAMAATYGPTPVPQAIERCQALLATVEGDRRATGQILGGLALLEAMRGNFPEARSLYRRTRALFEEFGMKLRAALTSINSGPVELLAGDPVAAEAELRRDYDALESLGEKNYISTTAAFLAEALSEQGRDDEADTFTRISQEIAAPDDILTQYLWRCVRGKVLARRGAFEDAEAIVREGLQIIQAAEEPDSQGNALLTLAVVLRAAEREDEALVAAGEAAELFDRKGSTVSAARARAFLLGNVTAAESEGAAELAAAD
jgi:predicted ATPase/class 3 adenylate cyclase